MEKYCEICDQRVTTTYNLRSTARAKVGIVCSGAACDGARVHAKCANLEAAVELLTASDNHGLFWFCKRCRRSDRKLSLERNAQQLEELSAIRLLTKKMVESVDENLHQVKSLLEAPKEKEDASCQYPESPGNETDLPTLPTEVWVEIFRRLTNLQLLRVRATCRRWREIVDGCPSIAAKFSLEFPKGLVMNSDYKPKHLFPVASKVCLLNAKIFEVSWWPTLGHGLTAITLGYCKCVLSTLLAMFKETPNLKSLTWDTIMVDELPPSGSAVDFVLPKLKKFSYSGDKDVGILAVLQKLCPNLKSLCIHRDEMDNEESEQIISFIGAVQQTLEALRLNCTSNTLPELLKFDQLKLKRLALNGENIEDKTTAVDFCRAHPTLESLHIQEGFSLRGSDLVDLGESLPKLECFATHLPGQMQIQPTFLANMAGLQHLTLVGEQHTIDFTGQGCPNLSHLTLVSLVLPEYSLQRLLAKSPNITCLTLDTICITQWSHLHEAISELRQLERLSLESVNTLETSLYDSKPLENLKFLEVNCCDFEKEALVALFGAFPRLVELNVYYMDRDGFLVQDVLNTICERLKHLEKLEIKACSLTLAQERQILETFQGLKVLKIADDFYD